MKGLRMLVGSFIVLFTFWFTVDAVAQSQVDFNPEGETYVILIDGTTRLYDPNVDYGSLGLKIAPDANDRNPLPKALRETIKARGTEASTFVVNYVNFTPQAQAAFQYAVEIWQSLVNSNVPINTYASWEPMSAGVLGSSTRMGAYRNFTGAPLTNVWYPVTLAEALHGSGLNGTGYDIYLRFNSNFQWYLGTDGNTPSGQYDFVTVVLHELCHGLGFYGSFGFTGGYGFWGSGGFPFVWDVHIKNGNGDSLLNETLFPNYSLALGAQITSNNVFYTNSSAVANNGGNWVSIYAPSTWSAGSSMVHVGEIFRNTRNSLMVYSISAASSQHSPGPVTLGMMKDWGWSISNLPPVLTARMPDFTLAKNSSNVFYLKLSNYFYDVNQYQLDSFAVYSSGNVTGLLRGDSLYLSAATDFTGKDTLIVFAVDTANTFATDTVVITVKPYTAATAGTLYGAGLAATGGLLTINTTTGSATVIGPTVVGEIRGLAISPLTNHLYGIFATTNFAKLLVFDTQTGEAFEQRIIPGANYRDIAFDTNNDLYISTLQGLIFKVNILTGDTTRVGASGISNLFGISINPVDGNLYGLNSSGNLYLINKENAFATLIGSTGFTLGRGISFDNQGVCYGISASGSNQPFYIIDPTTGVGTLIGLTGKTGINSIAVYGNSVSVSSDLANAPNAFSLSQNYPNPFNPSTLIRYQIGVNAKVTLRIFNILGQEVRTLVNGQTQSAGRPYEVVWDGKDNNGMIVSSGVYFYRLEAGSFVKTRKMMFVK